MMRYDQIRKSKYYHSLCITLSSVLLSRKCIRQALSLFGGKILAECSDNLTSLTNMTVQRMTYKLRLTMLKSVFLRTYLGKSFLPKISKTALLKSMKSTGQFSQVRSLKKQTLRLLSTAACGSNFTSPSFFFYYFKKKPVFLTNYQIAFAIYRVFNYRPG